MTSNFNFIDFLFSIVLSVSSYFILSYFLSFLFPFYPIGYCPSFPFGTLSTCQNTDLFNPIFVILSGRFYLSLFLGFSFYLSRNSSPLNSLLTLFLFYFFIFFLIYALFIHPKFSDLSFWVNFNAPT